MSTEEKHERYRNSGNALLAILITLCSGLLLWNIDLLDNTSTDEKVFIFVASIFIILSITTSLFALLFHYQGYKSEARSNDNSQTTTQATQYFDRADKLVPTALYAFLVGAAIDIVLLIMLRT